jgi:hypothetical protein
MLLIMHYTTNHRLSSHQLGNHQNLPLKIGYEIPTLTLDCEIPGRDNHWRVILLIIKCPIHVCFHFKDKSQHDQSQYFSSKQDCVF